MDIHSIYISLLIRNQGECPDTVLIMPVSMIMGKQNYFSPLFYISLLIRNQGECPDIVLIMPIPMIMGKQNYFSPQIRDL